MLARVVVVEVGVEVAVGVDGAEFEDGFGAVEAPAGAGDVEAVDPTQTPLLPLTSPHAAAGRRGRSGRYPAGSSLASSVPTSTSIVP